MLLLHEQESRDYLIDAAIEELKAECGSDLTDAQYEQILMLFDNERDTDKAISQVIEVKATVQIYAGKDPIVDNNGRYIPGQQCFDLVTFTTQDGESLERVLPDGSVERGMYVKTCNDPKLYDNAAKQWLKGVPGIWVVGTWN